METELILVIVGVALLLLIIMAIVIFKPSKKSVEENNEYRGGKLDLKDSLDVALIEKFMFRKEAEFYYFLQEILPNDKIAFPKIGVDTIIRSTGSRLAYNAVLGKTVDFVVFDEQTMKPILVIDIYDNTYQDEMLSEQDSNIIKVLDAVKLPSISLLVKNSFDRQELKDEILKKLDEITPKNKEENKEQNDEGKNDVDNKI